jgi:L-ascorbate metabolism protein UlaG (beta-lactamase superfamily)
VPGSARIFAGPGEYEVGKAFITGHSSFHDDERGAVRGKNTIYVVEMEGLTLCHAGDLGHALTATALKELGKVDILFVPVGDVTTFSVAEARALVRALQPRYVLPMHYRVEGTRPELEPVETFVAAMGLQPSEPRPRVTVSATSLPLNMQVAILTCESRVG